MVQLDPPWYMPREQNTLLLRFLLSVFIVTLLTIVRKQNQAKCPLTDK